MIKISMSERTSENRASPGIKNQSRKSTVLGQEELVVPTVEKIVFADPESLKTFLTSPSFQTLGAAYNSKVTNLFPVVRRIQS